MSLVPFVTDYLGKNYREPMAVALYGLDLVLCSSAFYFLRIILVQQDRHDSALAEYHESIQRKNAFSAASYLASVPLAYVSIYASYFIFALIPAMYFLPEKKLSASE
jgi:uncharacterized membrane protein